MQIILRLIYKQKCNAAIYSRILSEE